eukprot:1051908-Rhodomonas_salina.1
MILDASVHGYGGFWLEHHDSEPELFITPPPREMPWDEQVHQEMSAAVALAPAAAAQARGSSSS